MEALDKVIIHNIAEERNVGLFNYEVGIRGRSSIESASRKGVLKRSADLIKNRPTGEFKKFRKPAQEIKEIKLQ